MDLISSWKSKQAILYNYQRVLAPIYKYLKVVGLSSLSLSLSLSLCLPTVQKYEEIICINKTTLLL
jgi:hypothetical protein